MFLANGSQFGKISLTQPAHLEVSQQEGFSGVPGAPARCTRANQPSRVGGLAPVSAAQVCPSTAAWNGARWKKRCWHYGNPMWGGFGETKPNPVLGFQQPALYDSGSPLSTIPIPSPGVTVTERNTLIDCLPRV